MGDNSGSKASPGANKLSPPIGYDPGRAYRPPHAEMVSAALARLAKGLGQ